MASMFPNVQLFIFTGQHFYYRPLSADNMLQFLHEN